MTLPQRIVDLHTHLFNARYLPLASIIAGAMGRTESKLANTVARLLENLAGSSYSPEPAPPSFLKAGHHPQDTDSYYLNQLWLVAEAELLRSTGSLKAISAGAAYLQQLPDDSIALTRMGNSELMDIIKELDEIDYVEEGWSDALPMALQSASHKKLDIKGLGWAQLALKKSLWVVTRLMDRDFWGHADNLLEFFFTMLNSEERMINKVFAGYGEGLPPLQIVHYLMDMQMGYPSQQPPRYPFYPDQLNIMQKLQRDNPGRVFGFSAFDPRHENWETRANYALKQGFIGFKFYPSMGYKPIGNVDQPEVEARIAAFFDFCVREDVPVFAHCTPQGFQTPAQQGAFAHPKYWREVLNDTRWHQLRLCLGHAGGGHASNGKLESYGWMAETDAQWTSEDNFARIVAEMCVTFPNVYCEMGNITALLHNQSDRMMSTMTRAMAMRGDFPFMEKLAYGTDWHMPDLVDSTRKYLQAFLDIFDREGMAGFREGFFWKNSYRYLKLPE